MFTVSVRAATSTKSRDEIFVRGEDCNFPNFHCRLFLVLYSASSCMLLEVSKALDAAGRGESYIPLLRSPTRETSTLVDAFRRMQGQVSSRQIRLESILDNAAEGIITIDEQGIIETLLSSIKT